jgi:uncharacterized circularly permuted ATP-grasp superfamily protein
VAHRQPAFPQRRICSTSDPNSTCSTSPRREVNPRRLASSYTYGGKGVLVGDQHSPGQLRALLAADGSAWVAQRRVYTSSLDLRAADGRTVPYLFVLGMFLYGEGASGLLVRAAAHSPVVNVSQGGGAAWAFID